MLKEAEGLGAIVWKIKVTGNELKKKGEGEENEEDYRSQQVYLHYETGVKVLNSVWDWSKALGPHHPVKETPSFFLVKLEGPEQCLRTCF